VTFKQFVSDAGRVWLKALNPTYPPILDEFKVLGTIIGKWEDE
jgi:SOS-response transcriptional repressor LexA